MNGEISYYTVTQLLGLTTQLLGSFMFYHAALGCLIQLLFRVYGLWTHILAV